MELSLGLAFVAGLVSFASPCVLALLPVYLAYLGEAAGSAELTSGSAELATASGTSMAGRGLRIARAPLVGQAMLFSLAFGAVFVAIGISAGLLGRGLLHLVPFAQEAAGLAVIALGILTTGVFGPVTSRFGYRLPVTSLPAGRSLRSLALGGLFAVGWSPCIGTVLGAILAMAATSEQVWLAALLLAAYSAGLALPFLAVAAALPRLAPAIDLLRRWHRPVEVVAGLFIVLMGILILTNAFTRMAGLFTPL
jgi:cytochrome c-type biogenesis protein